MRHIRPTVSLEQRLAILRDLLAAGAASTSTRPFGERGPPHSGGHAVRAAGDVQGAARPTWKQEETFGPIEVEASERSARAAGRDPLERIARGAALPLARARLRVRAGRGLRRARGARSRRPWTRLGAEHDGERRGVVAAQGGRAATRWPPTPSAEDAARRLLARPTNPAADPGAGRGAGDRRLPAARVAARGRPDPRRRLGVGGGDADGARPDRGVRAARASARSPTAPRRCSSASSASRGSTRCRIPRSSTPRPRTSASCASGC